jgi:hypothetical protein
MKKKRIICSILISFFAVALLTSCTSDDKNYYSVYDYGALDRFLSHYESYDLDDYIADRFRIQDLYSYEEIKNYVTNDDRLIEWIVEKYWDSYIPYEYYSEAYVADKWAEAFDEGYEEGYHDAENGIAPQYF